MSKGNRKREEIEKERGSLVKYLKRPRTLEDLCEKFGWSTISTHRRLRELEDAKINIVRKGVSRPTKYQII